MSPLWSEIGYELAQWLCLPALTLAYSLRAEGGHRVPPSGPVLLAANHQSFLDPLVIGASVRRHLYYLARSTLFRHPWFAALIRAFHAVPIDQEGIGKEGLKTVLELLKEGRAVLLFPEGHRTSDGAMQPLRPGIELLIRRARVPVVPVGLAGAFEAWPRQARWPSLAPLFLPARRGALAVAVGPPISPESLLRLPREDVLRELAERMRRMQERAERLRRRPPEERRVR
ncbi:MAG: 1-acyl-sn-glycerol-3-phosphate acyltransferase [Gemmataceae bacterium]|nr:1-acyl-sn-glycerol-3-phosphate acyltransferase [Gemmataceae bacterium]MDW8265839.1 lysophospholipid acyltransferase family protein [Gemmataceae bacterium]